MARISFANALAGIRNAFGPGGQLRAKDQLAAVVDALLQMAGNANIAPGNSEPADPLNSPFTIYLNPYTGSDRFVGGSYNWFEEPGEASDPSKIAAKLKRLENQRLVCGYSRQAPFRTINRAAIEIVAMTSKNFFTINSEEANVDCPSVELSPGTHIFYNDPGNSSYAIPVTEWPAAGFDPTPNHLIAFNPNSGGIVLPRYATASAPLSLRQTTVRPSYVPAAADEAADYSNRVAILKITSTSYVYGFTFRDQFRASSSHHLLDCFHNASQADLDQLYTKVRTAMGGASNSGNLSNALAVTRPSEWQTVGPISGNPSEAWDTVKGASPYIYNCSLRTEWGMSGVFWDGARLAGLKSLVAAQFTGISQQRDLSCWEIYRSGAWRAPVNYQELIDSESDDVRMKPRRMSRHISLINDAFGQLVSIFAIGAGRHHLADSGAQMEFSNSTSNFGGCVAVAKGYQSASVALDSNWNLRRLRVARSVADQTGNIRRIPLGLVSAISGSSITLQNPLAVGADPAVPAVLAAGGHSLAAGTLIWIENPNGVDWRATLQANAWSSVTPTAIAITAAAAQAGTGEAIGTDGGVSLAVGRRVYVRRLIDTRSRAQRQVTLKLANTTSARVPLRNSIIQTRPGVGGGGISRVLASGGAEVLAVTQTNAIPAEGSGVVLSAEVTLRRCCPDEVYAAGVFVRQGQTVKHGGKHYTAKGTFTTSGSVPNADLWQQSYVQQESSYNAEDPTTLEGPVLIFDTDTDASSDVTATCGINWSTVYTASGSVRDQLRSATDYRGALALLLALGFTSTAAHAALVPRTEASRDLDPANATHFPTAPSGGAASERANWALEFRQPSFIQLLGQNLNGVGFWNYSRALPRARRPLSPLNEFNANFAPEQGGRVEVRGINKDGYEVTNQGLVSTDTGEVVAVEGIGAEGDQSLPTQFNDIAVENLSITGTLDVSGVVALDGGESIAMQTNRYGFGTLAPLTELLKTGAAAPVATSDAAINSIPELITVPGLNAWKNANQLISALTDEIIIYVSSTGVDRSLSDMIASPPTAKGAAVRSFGAAAQYANYLLAGSEGTAVVRTSPGYYYTTCRWSCNVRFEAWNSTFTAMPFPGDNFTSATIPNNCYDGTGYDNPNLIPQLIPWRLYLNAANVSGTTLVSGVARVNSRFSVFPGVMYFEKSVEYFGGFAFLGLAETIRYVAINPSEVVSNGQTRAQLLVLSAEPGLSTAAQINGLNYSTNTSTNVDQLLSSIRTATAYIGSFAAFTEGAVMEVSSRDFDLFNLRDCIFGPGLPHHKESQQIFSSPYIDIRTEVPVDVANIYLRGNTTITSAGIGCASPIDSSGIAHYGAAVSAPWTHRQFYHTFIGTTSTNKINIRKLGGLGEFTVQRTGAGTVGGLFLDYYADLTGKLLPNHIHLLTNSTTPTAPNSFTPAAGLAYPAAGDNDSGPFLDQFIHAKYGITFDYVWFNNYSRNNARPVWQGFLGRFGSNGHNSVKTRGVLLGNAQGEIEGGCEVLAGNRWWYGDSPFMKAGIIDPGTGISKAPFVQGSATFGEANPAVKNSGTRSITTRDNGSTTLDLNMGLVNWVRGSSPEYGTNIRPRNFAA
jgi:hypothetical protein